jgi:hypothetical protein
MKNQKNELATLSKSQQDCYLARPEEFEITRDDEEIFHGQSSDKLVKQTDAHGKSKFGAPRLPATEASDAGKPNTDGMDSE